MPVLTLSAFRGYRPYVGCLVSTLTVISDRTNRILVKQVSVIGVRAGENGRQDPSVIPGQWEGIFKIFKETKMRPVIYHENYVGLDEISKGLVDLARRRTYGKAVVMVDPSYKDGVGAKL